MPEASSQRGIIAYVKDLIFATKIRSTAEALGKKISVVQSADALKTEIESAPTALVIIDLNAGDDALEAVSEALKSVPAESLVAFVSHVNQEFMEAAKRLGAVRVLPRSRFSMELPQILCG